MHLRFNKIFRLLLIVMLHAQKYRGDSTEYSSAVWEMQFSASTVRFKNYVDKMKWVFGQKNTLQLIVHV